jgi:two-component system chemotaxis sensor kinase CheA
MDDIIAEFLTETNESLAELDNCLVMLEQNPNDAALISKIFRVIHTIKGTSGFLGLARLGSVAHNGEDVLGLFRDKKLEVTPAYVSLILECLDCIKEIIAGIEATGKEPPGDDQALIGRLQAVYRGEGLPASAASHEAPAPDIHHHEPDLHADLPPQSEPDHHDAHADLHPHAETHAAPLHEAAKASAPAAGGDSALSNQTLRVNVEALENLMTMVSELVLTRNQLLQMSRQHTESEFHTPLQRLNLVVSDLQDGVMKTRMQPVGNAWSKLPRIVRDVSSELGKKIELEMRGQDTELDRQVLDMIKDPLTHMVRNSADHGIETPAERIAKGKPETGKILLNSFHQGGHIIIEISDDGKGLPMDKIRKKLLENNLVTPEQLESLSTQQIQQFIFHAGFSTADKITAVSGRGVGMDVVRSNIEKIGGSIEMKSVEGQGTTFTIKIPLTLAIISSLIVGVSGERFAIPQLTVSELVMVGQNNSSQIEMINNTPVLRLREKLLPLIFVDEFLTLPPEQKSDKRHIRYIVVTRGTSITFGLVVDHVFDMEEIVVKPVSENLKSLQIFSGNTILGDGKVIMILDPAGIFKVAGMSDISDASMGQKEEEKIIGNSGAENLLLLFMAGEKTLKAVPLHMVSRLEEVNMEEIEVSDGRNVIQYLGELMPVYNLDEAESDRKKRPLIIFRHEDHNVGLMADKILDITKYYGDLNQEGGGKVLDSIIVNEQATDVINPFVFAA